MVPSSTAKVCTDVSADRLWFCPKRTDLMNKEGSKENMSVVLDEAEVSRLSGGYVRPSDQLRELKSRGYWRAYRSGLTGKVVLTLAHVEAVESGATSPKPVPKLRLA